MKEYTMQIGIMPHHPITGHTIPPLGQPVRSIDRLVPPVRIEDTFDEYARRIWDDLSAIVEKTDPIMRKMAYFLLRHKYNISIDHLDDQIDRELRQSYKAETK